MTTAITTQNDIIQMINLSDLADSSKDKYRRAITKFLDTGHGLGDREALRTYAANLSNTGKAHLKAVIKLWTKEIATMAKSQSTPETVGAVTATLHRLDALNETIKVKASRGTKPQTWLSLMETKQLFGACKTDLQGKRDKIILGLLTGAGLRREEAVNVKFSDLSDKPVKGQVRTVLHVIGKGRKDREIPLGFSLASVIRGWGKQFSKSDYVVQRLGNDRTPKGQISGTAIYQIVKQYGAYIGKPDLQPHDLRRTFAQIGHDAGVPITQLSILLGHSNIATTQRYLNLALNLETTVSDFVPFE